MATRRRTWIWLVAGAVLLVLAAVTLIWFQPQKLFYDNTVDEALPTVSAPADSSGSDGDDGASTEPVELATGTFISREHETTGTATWHTYRPGGTEIHIRARGPGP
jgi:hypothetical protein